MSFMKLSSDKLVNLTWKPVLCFPVSAYHASFIIEKFL